MSTNLGAASSDDLAKCRKNLRLIGEAVAAYRQDHGDQFPPTLGDLVVRRFLTDSAVLKCPVAVITGNPGPANPELISPGENDGQVVGYNWEFSWDDPSFWEGAGHQMRFHDFKRLQLQSIVGKYLPIIRCSHHPDRGQIRVLNLTGDGQIYESGEYWEANFVDLLPGIRLTPELVHMANLPIARLVRPRPAQAADTMIDLRRHYNARFEDPWIHSVPGEEWLSFSKALEDGVLTSRGIAFDPAGIIQLNGRIVPKGMEGYSRLIYPTNVPTIELKRVFRVMHVLGGVVFESPQGSVVARLEFLSEDGKPLGTWEWRYGIDVAQVIYPTGEEWGAVGNSHIAWIGNLGPGQADGKRARLFHLKFTHPAPEVAFSRLRFLPGDEVSAPMIGAITLEE